jgi:hypothetical protein
MAKGSSASLFGMLRRSNCPRQTNAVFGSGPLAVRGLIEEVHDLAERIAGLVGLDEVAVVLWTWLRLPVALFLLAAVLSVVYRFAPDVD